jgi:secreted trypsin-like serine protease
VARHRVLTLLVAALLALVIAPVTASADDPADVSPNIVGGSPATDQYHAFSVWDPSVGRSRCTGVVIAPRWGVLAAHCGLIITPGVTEIRASSRDNRVDYENAGVLEFIPHHQYNEDTGVHDIALVHFAHEVERTAPVSIARDTVRIGTVTRVAGWGWTCEDPGVPSCQTTTNILQQLDTRIVPPSTCPLMPDPANQLCVVSADGKPKNACRGDSGGPMLAQVLGTRILVGITLGDGDDGTPRPYDCATNPAGGPGAGVWLDVTHYRDWINETMSVQ